MGTLKVKAPQIHIYPFSRLVGAPAARWEKLIAELEAKEKIVYLYYQPVREAIVKLTAKNGLNRDQIFNEMSDRAKAVVCAPSQDPVKDNQGCFKCFEKSFQSKIFSFEASLLRASNTNGTFFNGVILRGLPHMIVRDSKNKLRYVYLYPSAWKDHELDSYIETLTIIIESEYNAQASDLWIMSLKTGKSIPRSKSKSRSRSACREAATLFKRMIDSGLIHD